MMRTQLTERDEPVVVASTATPEGQAQVRELAIKQIERKRRFRAHAFFYGAVSLLLIVIWAITEYHNAGGWPSSGFSQSSSIPHKWNIWIIYPLLGIGLIVSLEAWRTYGEKPISEHEIEREIDQLRNGGSTSP
jgi:hypothetical protein